jgi:hypothetical protein
MTEDSNAGTSPQDTPSLGRNEPCHCGSGKKYKRCHGVSAAPKLSAPKQPAWGANAGGDTTAGAGGASPFGGGFDPSKMDPQMMQQFAQSLQRLPKGQLQKLQSIMQRAMAGKDVAKESAEFERTLPPELQQLMLSFAGQMGQQMGGMAGGIPGAAALPGAGATAEAQAGGMSEEEARRIVEAAAAEGKISSDEAEKLLTGAEASGEKKGLGKLWRGLTGNKSP